MFCHILLPICSLILTNLCNGQLIEDGQIGKKSDKEPKNKQPTSQPPAATSLPSSDCSFIMINGVLEICPLIEDSTQPGLFSWKFGIGEIFAWDEGPTEDASGSVYENGYMFANMHESICQSDSAMMIMKPMPKTEAIGKCLSIQYAIDGISVKQFDVVMMVNSPLPTCQNNTSTINYSSIPVILWSTTDITYTGWKTKQITYSSHYEYNLVFNAIPTEIIGDYSSYVAIDNLKISNGHCENDCNFNKDFCDWKNSMETQLNWVMCNTLRDDSNEPSGGDTSSGGMACIPNERQQLRKVGYKARLISKEIIYWELPKCMRFQVFMMAEEGVTLRILKQDDAGHQTEIWSAMSKKVDFGWHPYQVTISDKNPITKLKVIVEAEIVQPGRGELGIDAITFEDHNCPKVQPPNIHNSILDCTFDVSTCSWTIIQPTACSKSIPTSMVSRVSGNQHRPKGHSRNPYNRVDSYILFDFGSYLPLARDSGFLVSPIFTGKNDEYCFSFWFLMYNTDTAPFSTLGSLSLIMVVGEKEVTLWKLTNGHNRKWVKAQVPIKATKPYHLMFKATKGCIECGVIAIDDISFYSYKCKTEPKEAESSPLDCDFSDGLCNYANNQAEDPNEIIHGWQSSTTHCIQAGCYDNTYEITPGGFAFASAVSPGHENQVWRLESPVISGNTEKCFTFFYKNLSSDNDGAKLEIIRGDKSHHITTPYWRIKAIDVESRDGDWIYGQVSFIVDTPYQIIIAAEMQHGGWAIDDIKLKEGSC